ncbi:hypothetical protein ESA_04279 [Cronobacter sakazakii ATCC BAA-894]|uniref:Uncharacterized protein n=1 Tax=Cronobacter sakazakii (strain ATCC BAA-894) TaxID=290339 RepID=A7MH93_CROS8|nr:hypothetical protein ESA_04279 [Cronobacter sakazakii ATCC BAA-894]
MCSRCVVVLASEIFKLRACQPPEACSFAGHPKDAPLWPAAARRPGHKAGALGVIPVRFTAGFGLPCTVGALRLPTLRSVSGSALRLPTLRAVFFCLTWRVRCAYPPYGQRLRFYVGRVSRAHPPFKLPSPLAPQRAGEDLQRFAELRIRNGQRIKETDNVAVNATAQQQQPLFTGARQHLLRKLRRRLAGLRIVKLYRHHRALPANFGNRRAVRPRLVEHLLQMLAQLVRALAEIFLLNHIQHRVRCRDRQRVTGVGAAKAARRRRVHYFRAPDHARERHPARKAFRHRQQIRLHAVMLHREQFAGARKAALYFIGNQQNAVLVAQRAQGLHKRRRRDVETAFALYRLQHDGGHLIRRDIGFENTLQACHRVIHRHAVQGVRVLRVEHRARERAEADFVRCHFAGERHRHKRAPVKAAAEGD